MPLSRTELQVIIDEVIVDCYGDDEARTGFLVAIEQCLGPDRPGVRIAGFDTTLVGIDDGGDRRGLLARVRHGRSTHEVALWDVVRADDPDSELAVLLAAYREWCGR